jgi:hypothetical protein
VPINNGMLDNIREKESPCIGVCTLEDDVCIGCNRTMDEIREAYIESMRRDFPCNPIGTHKMMNLNKG